MTFSISSHDGGCSVAIRGSLDVVTRCDLAPALSTLLTQRPAHVDVDLSELRLIDSCGIGLLVWLYKQVHAHGGDLAVRGLRNQPLSVFRLLRLDQVMIAHGGAS